MFRVSLSHSEVKVRGNRNTPVKSSSYALDPEPRRIIRYACSTFFSACTDMTLVSCCAWHKCTFCQVLCSTLSTWPGRWCHCSSDCLPVHRQSHKGCSVQASWFCTDVQLRSAATLQASRGWRSFLGVCHNHWRQRHKTRPRGRFSFSKRCFYWSSPHLPFWTIYLFYISPFRSV